VKTICVVQARTGSTRLPGKVLADIGGEPLLGLLLSRLRPLPVDEIVVATSDRPADDAVAALAKDLSVAAVRGPEDDVLARFAVVLAARPADTVIRITADCPFTDPQLVAEVLERHRDQGADYTTNVIPRTFPKGLDVEVASAAALLEADREARDPREREHVMPFLYRHPERFRLANIRCPELLGEERWDVDTPADLARARELVELMPTRDAPWRELLAAAGRRAKPPASPWIRPATEADGDLLFEWRNDPDAIRFSRSGAGVEREEHRAWLRAALYDPGRRIWMLETESGPVGSVRITVRAAEATVATSIDAAQRGQGLGTAGTRLLGEELASDIPQVDAVIAEVHEDNRSSQRMFEAAGYKVFGRDGPFRLLRFDVMNARGRRGDLETSQ